MKIGNMFPGFSISAEGLSLQRKRMELIAENIANADVTRMANGQPYQRKTLQVSEQQNMFADNLTAETGTLKLITNDQAQIAEPTSLQEQQPINPDNLTYKEVTDQTPGDMVYMPSSPYANKDGYVQQSNVNIVTEMVDMISASRSYEANLTALNSSKQMVKDSLEI